MITQDLILLYILPAGITLFSFGYFIGKWRGSAVEEVRREQRAKKVIQAMFYDMKGQQYYNDKTINIEDIVNQEAPNSYDKQLLEYSLEQALKDEDYETAARLRDLLNKQ
jgi:hypothetical protein